MAQPQSSTKADASSQETAPEGMYVPLARKYRSQHFDELIGQPALVQTLKNAIKNDRLHHAYLFTGVRGIGKTSAARLLARAVNYTGPDGEGEPTVGPTDDCPVCQAIAEDRHPDVIEMDAASHTGVDDIRDLIETVKYAPTSARYKVYIIDEVHMLSKAAFNALLKTLEEPPSHVIFILATTEINKVPVTILSRCQRFDLRRVAVPELIEHYRTIANQEGVEIDDAALSMIAHAADGSVRDGLSLLDQAISLSEEQTITAEMVEAMLGKADRALIFDIFDALMNDNTDTVFEKLAAIYETGGDPGMILTDLLDLTHLISRLKATPTLLTSEKLGPLEKERGKPLAESLSVPALTRLWQMLMQGAQELNTAPDPYKALEMVMIRISYSSDMPPLHEIVDRLKKND